MSLYVPVVRAEYLLVNLSAVAYPPAPVTAVTSAEYAELIVVLSVTPF
jgi:hypothetical protein